jgi:uncharacterized membrane protein
VGLLRGLELALDGGHDGPVLGWHLRHRGLRDQGIYQTRGTDQAMDVLRRRFASGEITPDEFEKMRKALQG